MTHSSRQHLAACEEGELKVWNARKTRGQEGFLSSGLIKVHAFSDEDILKVLSCSCNTCKGYRNLVRQRRDPLQLETFVEQITSDSISFFALLASYRKAVLIIPFLRQGKFDEQILGELAEKPSECARRVFKDILDKDDLPLKPAGIVELLDNQIEGNWTAFLRPAISNVKFRKYNDRHMLPIYDEAPVGAGASSNVFAFRIFPGYNKIESASSQGISGRLVRKELNYIDLVEIDTLWALNSSGHPHIVRLLTSYQHENKINLVFQLSDTNLRQFLRDSKLGLGQSNFANIDRAPIWEEVAGIVDALHLIHTGLKKIQIHFDLKPENILVNTRGNRFHFLITDFGLAVQRDPIKQGSKIRYGGGDAGYGPPETTDLSRSYDIWSMGCIILEILSFTIWGFRGPKMLDDARGTQYKPFWHSEGEMPLLKPGIGKVLDDMKKLSSDFQFSSQTLSPRNKKFVRAMVSLVEKMLRIRQTDRLTSQQVLRRLKAIREDRDQEAYDNDTDTPASPQSPPQPRSNSAHGRHRDAHQLERGFRFAEPVAEEQEIGGQLLKNLGEIYARSKNNPNQEDQPAVLQLFQRMFQEELKLRFVMTLLNEEIPIEYQASRKALALVPAYAFRVEHNVARSLAGLRLIQDNDPYSGMSHNLDGDLIDLRQIHGVLMQQEIIHSAMISNLRVDLRQSRRLLGLFRKTSGQATCITDSGPITIQLWRETHSIRRECRLVFYIRNSKIVIMRFNEALGFCKEEVNTNTESPILPSYLNRGARSARFSLIKGSPDQEQAALSLDPGLFRRQCMDNESSLERIEMRFEDFDARRQFVSTYRKIKEVWAKECS